MTPLPVMMRAAIARRALLEARFREELCTDVRGALARGGFALPDDEVERVAREIGAASEVELSRLLWSAAQARPSSSWTVLREQLGRSIEAIEAWMHALIDRLPDDGRYAPILHEVMMTWPASVRRTPSSVLWCLAVTHSTRPGDMPWAWPLAAACGFYYQGVVILDDIADGELEPTCRHWPRGQIEHLAYSMAGALPFLALGEAAIAEAHRSAAVRALAEAIWITNIGQYLDLRTHGVVWQTAEEAECVARRKTADGIALLTRVTVAAAGIPSSLADAWVEATRSFATARQIASDVRDIWHKPVSPDLYTGKCTLPIVYAAARTRDAERRRLEELRARCRYEHAAHVELRLLLERLDVLGAVQERLQELRADGERWLARTNASSEALSWIRTWAGQGDVFGEV